jgi:hypothetical protein
VFLASAPLVPDAFARAAALCVVSAFLTAACASTQDTIRQQREKLESLGASTRLLADDWLAGHLAQRYTRTAFDALFLQVEQQRAALATTPEALADPQGAALSQQAEQLSRTIAELEQDLERGDNASLRARASRILLAGSQ